MDNKFVNKEYLMDRMRNAKTRVRVLEVVAFDFDWTKIRNDWLKRIDAGTLQAEIITESE